MCKRAFKTYQGLLKHVKYCKIKNDKASNKEQPQYTTNEPGDELPTCSQNQTPLIEKFKWDVKEGTVFAKELNAIYDEIVCCRRNLFLLPTGSIGKKYIHKVTRLLKAGGNLSMLISIGYVFNVVCASRLAICIIALLG